MTDLFPIRVVVVAMAIVLVGSVAACTFLAFTQTPIPDLLGTLAVAAMTGTSALLAKTGGATAGPTDVQVVNQPGDPVPVSDEAAPAAVYGDII